MKKVTFCFSIIFVALLSNFIFGAIPAEERAALIALYNSTNGDGWYSKNGWKTPPLHTDRFAMPGTEGSWFGVTLSGDNVNGLNLSYNGLSGSIPSQLDNLCQLMSLNLLNNKLSGNIPSQLGNLSQLEYLELGENQLSGSIPAQLGNLSKLGWLSMVSNQLSGSIPAQLGNLSNLVYISLDYNQLNGGIPSQLGNLNNLETLRLDNNQLSGSIPAQFGNISNLRYLCLKKNQLSGAIPVELGNLSKLIGLYLQENQLSGSIPAQLGNLNNLEMLWLYDNQLSGSIPSKLGNLIKLTELDLGSNQLSGNISSQLGNLSNLAVLDLHNNQLSGNILSELGNLINLVYINLSVNQLSGTIPSNFINLTKIPPAASIYLHWAEFGYNCLSAKDTALRAWLNGHDPDWEAHQDQCGDCDDKSLKVGNLTFYADAICKSGNDYALSGNVNIDNKLWFSGDVLYKSGSSSTGTFTCMGFPFVKLSKENQSIFTATDLLYNVNGVTNHLTPLTGILNYAISLTGIPLKVSTDPIVITNDGVLLSGKIEIGAGDFKLCDVNAEVLLKPGDKIYIKKAGISATTSKIPGIKLASINLEYDGNEDELSGSVSLEFPFLGLKEIDASISVQPGCIDGFSIAVALKKGIALGTTGITINGFTLEVDNICTPTRFKIFFGGDAGFVGISSDVLLLGNMGLGYEHPFRLNFEGGTVKFLGCPIAQLRGYIDASSNIARAGAGINGSIDFKGIYVAEVDLKLLSRLLKFNGNAKGALQIPDFDCETWKCKVIKAIITHYLPLPYQVAGEEMDIEIWKNNGTWTGSLKGMVSIFTKQFAVELQYVDGNLQFLIGTNFEDMVSIFENNSEYKVLANSVEQSITLPAATETIIFSAGGNTTLPQIYLKTPQGEVITANNVNSFSGVTYIENSNDSVSLFMLDTATAGQWTIGVSNLSSSEVNFGIYAKRPIPKTSFTQVTKSGNNLSINAAVTPVKEDIRVSLYFSERSSGGTGSPIAENLNAASGSISTVWDTDSIVSGTYYIYAKTNDNLNAPVITYYNSPIVIDYSGIKAPKNLQGSSSGDSVELTWTPSTSSTVIGYLVLYTDEPRVGGYKYQISSIAKNNATIDGLNQSKTYRFCVVAFDGNGNSSIESNTFTTVSSGTPEISLNQTRLNFGALYSGSISGPQTVLISNNGNGTLNWNASGNDSWLSVAPSSGTGVSALSVSVNPAGLAVGSYIGTITITDPNASNSPQVITVQLQIYNPGTTAGPFGDFSTPLEGSSTYSSVPVTGWALDDTGIASVKIYNGDAYIGEAIFVDGARPDIEAAYPTYPNNYKAGWGYMLLTHFLPNGGNGTYTLIAKATDMEGNELTLGSKTITIDNAHAVKPFGAIDTPTQGGTASGKSFVNYGWALTPQPNSIPVDGSTTNVVIDGVVKGHPVYNVFRSDIATLFPGYANTNGAVGYYYIDATKLSNGVHTIAWIVTDNAENSDGIGSRYFSVMNTQTSGDSSVLSDARLSQYREPSEGFLSLEPAEELNSEIKELERVEINLSDEGVFEGYLVVGDQLRGLPIGSTLDRDRGVFYWQPGPGFIGEYRLIFIGKDCQGQYTRKTIVINIKPMH